MLRQGSGGGQDAILSGTFREHRVSVVRQDDVDGVLVTQLARALGLYPRTFGRRIDGWVATGLLVEGTEVLDLAGGEGRPRGRAHSRSGVAQALERVHPPDAVALWIWLEPRWGDRTGDVQRETRPLTEADVRALAARGPHEDLREGSPGRVRRIRARRRGSLSDRWDGLVMGLLRSVEAMVAEHLVAEAARLLGRTPHPAAGGVSGHAVQLARARVLLDDASEAELMSALLLVNALRVARLGPWMGRFEEQQRTAAELFRLHERVAYKRDRWQRDLDHVVLDLEAAMRRHPEDARLLAFVVCYQRPYHAVKRRAARRPPSCVARGRRVAQRPRAVAQAPDARSLASFRR